MKGETVGEVIAKLNPADAPTFRGFDSRGAHYHRRKREAAERAHEPLLPHGQIDPTDIRAICREWDRAANVGAGEPRQP